MARISKNMSVSGDSLAHILADKANYPLAEQEVLRILHQAIEAGGKVTVRDEDSGNNYRLEIKDGKFMFRD